MRMTSPEGVGFRAGYFWMRAWTSSALDPSLRLTFLQALSNQRKPYGSLPPGLTMDHWDEYEGAVYMTGITASVSVKQARSGSPVIRWENSAIVIVVACSNQTASGGG